MARFSLLFVQGPMEGHAIHFEAAERFIFGREGSPRLELPRGDTTSRHHFALEVNPPQARLRDLGSKNGTYINGRRVGRREQDDPLSQLPADQHWEELGHGDEIRAGPHLLRVETDPLVFPARALEDGTPLANDLERLFARSELGTRYLLRERIAEGGMGAVHRLRRRSDGRELVLKVMLPQYAQTPAMIALFLRETAVLAQLEHPSIVRLYECGEVESVLYAVMELCRGGSLREVLLERGKLPLEESVAFLIGALDGLAYAHARGFIHRDIKPENLLLPERGARTTKLADFGLAKPLAPPIESLASPAGPGAGTARYMPREQLVDHANIGPWSDVYSFAATLYETITGVVPRPADAPPAIMPMFDALPMRQLAPELPEAVAAVMDTALATDHQARFPDAGSFRHALLTALPRGLR